MIDEVLKDKIEKMLETTRDRMLLQVKDTRMEIENLPESDDKSDVLMSFDTLVEIIYKQAIIIEYLLQNSP